IAFGFLAPSPRWGEGWGEGNRRANLFRTAVIPLTRRPPAADLSPKGRGAEPRSAQMRFPCLKGQAASGEIGAHGNANRTPRSDRAIPAADGGRAVRLGRPVRHPRL